MQMKNQASTNGLILILLGALLWSTNGVFIKWLTLSPFLLAGMRALIAGVLLLPFVRPTRIPWNWYTLLMLISYAALCTAMVLALRNTSPPIAVGMQYTAPLWFFVADRIAGRPFHKASAVPLLLLLAGIVFFMCSPAENVTLAGNLYALSTGLSFALLTYCSKKVCADNPLGVTSISNLFTALVIFMFFADIHQAVQIPRNEWLPLLYLGVFQIGMGYACYYAGLKYTTPQGAAMTTPIEIVLGPLWVMIFLKEYPDVYSAVGFLFVITSVIMETIRGFRTHPSKSGRETPAKSNTKEAHI